MSVQRDYTRRRIHLQERGRGYRSHPVDYSDESYPWGTPPLSCAACGTRGRTPYRTLRSESGQVLVLHDACGRALEERLNPLPLGEVN